MNIARKLLGAGAATALAAATVGVLASPAQAASYNGACGDGYRVIDQVPLAGSTVFLTYNGGWNCVVTVSNTPGKSVWMGAQLKRSSDTKWQRDADVYSYYAGPVYRYAPSQCIDWGGQFDNGGVVIPNDHCG